MKAILLPGLLLVFSWFSYGQTPLEKAAKANQVSKMKALVEKGANVNATDANSIWEHTPLIRAAKSGSYEAASFLLEKGAKIDLYNAAGSTALIEAVQANNLKMATLLLKYKPNLEIATDDGSNRTPIIWAILEKNPEMVSTLLKAGAKPDVVFQLPFMEDPNPTSALQLAQKLGKKETIELLKNALK